VGRAKEFIGEVACATRFSSSVEKYVYLHSGGCNPNEPQQYV